MLKALAALLGKTEGERPPARSLHSTTPKPLNPGGDYRAVSLTPSIIEQCAGVKGTAGKRYLMREAPRLPLADCTMPAKCACKFHKHADRREGDRRLLFGTHTNRSFAGPERRTHANRRSTTH